MSPGRLRGCARCSTKSREAVSGPPDYLAIIRWRVSAMVRSHSADTHRDAAGQSRGTLHYLSYLAGVISPMPRQARHASLTLANCSAVRWLLFWTVVALHPVTGDPKDYTDNAGSPNPRGEGRRDGFRGGRGLTLGGSRRDQADLEPASDRLGVLLQRSDGRRVLAA